MNNLALTLMSSDAEDYDIVFQYFDLAKQTYEEKSACNIEGYAELLFNMGEANIKNGEHNILLFFFNYVEFFAHDD